LRERIAWGTEQPGVSTLSLFIDETLPPSLPPSPPPPQPSLSLSRSLALSLAPSLPYSLFLFSSPFSPRPPSSVFLLPVPRPAPRQNPLPLPPEGGRPGPYPAPAAGRAGPGPGGDPAGQNPSPCYMHLKWQRRRNMHRPPAACRLGCLLSHDHIMASEAD
jgi:hypothetical protein